MALEDARRTWREEGEVLLDTELTYDGCEPVRVLVRKRGNRYHLDDRGAAVRRAGRPAGWLQAAEFVVARTGMNVNRVGTVFVPAIEGRDLAALALKVAESSADVHGALLELDSSGPTFRSTGQQSIR